jgi:hypothetical protein
MPQPEIPSAQNPELAPIPTRRKGTPWYKSAWVWLIIAFVAILVIIIIQYDLFGSKPAQPSTDEPGAEESTTAPSLEITLRESETEITQYFGPEQNGVPLAELPPPLSEAPPLTFNQSFAFDGLEITCSDAVRWEYIDNEFSDHHMADVFAVPVTIKNIGRESNGLNLLYYTKYGPDGLELDNISFYFDSDLHSSGDIRPGATMTGDMYFLYNGDGDYYVEFENFLDKKELLLPIKKPEQTAP